MTSIHHDDDAPPLPQSPDPASACAAAHFTIKTDIVVIGAGQAGLSAAYHLKKRGLTPGRGFVVLDHASQAGGA